MHQFEIRYKPSLYLLPLRACNGYQIAALYAKMNDYYTYTMYTETTLPGISYALGTNHDYKEHGSEYSDGEEVIEDYGLYKDAYDQDYWATFTDTTTSPMPNKLKSSEAQTKTQDQTDFEKMWSH